MILLEQARYNEIYRMYCANPFFFPLIAAVLLNEQNGKVYVNNLSSPSQIYVEHSFGFAQIFGQSDNEFEQQLKHYFFVDKSFAAPKIRLYAPNLVEFLASPTYEPLSSFRQRFTLCKQSFSKIQNHPPERSSPFTVDVINPANGELIENSFLVANRFWRNLEDFILKSHAVVAFFDNRPASICYSAATANDCLEIDVLTLPEYRNQGLGKLVVNHFIKRSLDLSLSPLWDCFTNNSGSMMLCKSVGFLPANEPYAFFTINK